MSTNGSTEARKIRSRLNHCKSDIRDLFVPRFYFGCEADDPVNAWALSNGKLVGHGLIIADDFRDCMFANAVRFWGEVNPDFLKGTAVKELAAETLARSAGVPAAR